MSKLMLIDAMHAEETRVVVLTDTAFSGQRPSSSLKVKDFDFESHARKQLRGNIYLAKVTRVEPSLQAAFVEYGGNRQGFLAFNEIHPDYYQIPVADREALMAELAAQAQNQAHTTNATSESDEDGAFEDEGDDLPDEERRLRQHLIRRYKIQEVIKRRQILLVQVVKEERGNKGAALTTYMSLAGRYGVLMPNTARGGGISRKITSAPDRKRLKAMVASLDVPQGMGLIIRTAGAKRTKLEIKRDYDYLLRVWENIRETTLKSNAPALIYEEEDLVKRAVRDLFDKDFDAVLVEGEAGFASARDFMRMIMPSQAKKVQLYKASAPLFARYGIEEHLSKIYSPVVPLKSGGYLVINQTEALVAIDVNSGKSTKERNIEATALKTNIEAAEEAAHQMRLRDLAGLVVIDFIDMDEGKNNRAVEKVLKDALAEDRARIQMGKISDFGLMEISRQRRRTGVLEGTTIVCPHCEGMGRIRSVDSSALSAMRAIDLEAMQNGAGVIVVKLSQAVALYILNEKQAHLTYLRQEWGLKVNIEIDNDLVHTQHEITRTVHASEVEFTPPQRTEPLILDSSQGDEVFDEDDDAREDSDDEAIDTGYVTKDSQASRPSELGQNQGHNQDQPEDEARGPRRRRRRRGGRDRQEASETNKEPVVAVTTDSDVFGDEDDENNARNRKRRRGRRGGRRAGFETRPRETYSWIRARTPSLEAPYVWIDPFEEQQKRYESNAFVDIVSTGAPILMPSSLTEPVEAVALTMAAPQSLVPPDRQNQSRPKGTRPPRRAKADARVLEPLTEALNEAEDDPKTDTEVQSEASAPRKRRTRAKSVALQGTTEQPPIGDFPVADFPANQSLELSPAVKPTRRRKKPAEDLITSAEAEIEKTVLETKASLQVTSLPVIGTPSVRELETADAAISIQTIDPNEITALAEKPKKGWWRR
jgi:ribonuclease E